MVFGKIKTALFKRLKRSHPDIYDALKEYCDKHGYNMGDVVASAVATFMAADEEGKKELLEKMAQRRTAPVTYNVSETLRLFKDFCNIMGDMFRTINEARASMSVQALISDFKAVSNAMNEIQKAGSEAGKGSLEDLLAAAFIQNLLGQFGVRKSPAKTTSSGRGKVIDVGEES